MSSARRSNRARPPALPPFVAPDLIALRNRVLDLERLCEELDQIEDLAETCAETGKPIKWKLPEDAAALLERVLIELRGLREAARARLQTAEAQR